MSVFNVKQPPSVNKNETKPVVAPPAGKVIVNSRENGDPLPNTSTDTPDHPPEIAWPKAGGADDKRMPYKGMSKK
jgi:hypothetical protein